MGYNKGCEYKLHHFMLCIASNELKQAEGIASKYTRTKAVELSVHNASDLSQLIGKHHLVIRCGQE